MGDIDTIVKEFLIESYENLDQLDRNLVALEQEPTSRDVLSTIFRTIHTIKGTCGFLGFVRLESVAHIGESLLSRLRDGYLLLTPDITTALLAMADAIRQMLAAIESTGQDGDGDYSALITTLTRLQERRGTGERVNGRRGEAQEEQAPSSEFRVQKARIEDQSLIPNTQHSSGSQFPASPSPAFGELLIEEGLAQPEDIEQALEQQARGDRRKLGEILVNYGVIEPHQIVEVVKIQKEARTSVVLDSTIRVDVGLLDKLMNLVGELVLTRNQVVQFAAAQKDGAFAAAAQRLTLITSELQEGVMKIRMQPIGNLWSKLPRVVRDLAISCGKQARVEMEGRKTKLDKALIEAIKDPLTHLVRNAVDHGLESPEKRIAAGKPAEGVLSLRAHHEGGQVNLEISDDGGGVHCERVKQKALERGLISAEQAVRLSDREVAGLIFLPGFSTAEKVTNVSGRGVGLDVVKTNIEKIGGTIELQSKPGQGTTFKIKIPLTLAIIPALTITDGGARYAIPQVNLIELVRLEGGGARAGVEMIHGASVYRLRGNLLPIVYLGRELKPGEGAAAARGGAAEVLNIVVLQANDRQFGLVVDGINDTQEIVVKPLGKQLKGVSVFAGATIMGDGKVALILDVVGIAQRAGVVAEVRERVVGEQVIQMQEQEVDKQMLLLFRVGADGRMALPLSQVARLEEFPPAKVERAGSQEVVQYRGQIMPLLRLSQILGVPSEGDRDPLQVVVSSLQGRNVGLVVDCIIDIVEETVTVQSGSQREGVVGAAVIQQQVMDLIDVPDVIRMLAPTFFEQAEAA